MSEGAHGTRQIIKKGTGLLTLVADWDGTTATFTLPGDYPIKGLLFDLSDAATLTFTVEEAGLSFDLYKADGSAALSLGDGADTEIAYFGTAFGPFQNFKVTADASQTNAVIYAMCAS